jgi:hypothetical protein
VPRKRRILQKNYASNKVFVSSIWLPDSLSPQIYIYILYLSILTILTILLHPLPAKPLGTSTSSEARISWLLALYVACRSGLPTGTITAQSLAFSLPFDCPRPDRIALSCARFWASNANASTPTVRPGHPRDPIPCPS